MKPIESERWLAVRAARSLERSHARRAAAAAERRRRCRRRVPGSAVALLAAASLAGVGGLSAAAAEVKQARAAASHRSAAVYREGSRGPGVAALQRALGIRPTGRFGPETRRAVTAFQRRRGLAVDGIAGPQTLRALGLAGRRTSRRSPPNGGVQPRTAPRRRRPAPSALLERIARCESGGNPRAIGGGGRYRGKYQFTRETWRALGGRGDPARAPEAEQDRIAARLLARRGPGAWPRCGR